LLSDAIRRVASAATQGVRTFWSSPGDVFEAQECERHVLRLLDRRGYLPLADASILEVGCGTGAWLRQLVRWGARAEHLTGIDVLPDAVGRARQRLPPGVRIQIAHAARLPFSGGCFDIVLQATLFTSVLDPRMRQQIAAEMLRVVKPGGLILWYDFHVNNPRNPDVRRVTGREIHDLFPDCRIELRRCTLAPPLARLVAPGSWLLAHLLNAVPLLRTHYLGAITQRTHASTSPG
jgi:ubiquinone/menaquinone biosynthesis C-methylase UbiE